MKQFEFNHAHQQWDSYRRFHCKYYPFVEFANGELLIMQQPDPHQRQMYEKYGVQIVTTTDRDVPRLFLDPKDEKPIPKAWVQQGGQQFLAVDWERQVAVGINWRYHAADRPDAWNTCVPDNLRNTAMVYWAGPKRLPVSSSNICVSKVDKEKSDLLKDKLPDIKAAVVAAYRIQKANNPSKRSWWKVDKFDVREQWLDKSVTDIVAEILADEHHTQQVAEKGFAPLRIVDEVPYLYVKGE